MDHIKQNDPECLPDIQKIGCFFRSCGLISEYKTGRALDAEAVNSTWTWAKDTGRIGNDPTDKEHYNCIRDSASIATRFLRDLEDGGRWLEIGLFKDGKVRFYPAVSQQNKHIDALIQKITQNGPSKTHFRVVDSAGKLVEDPHTPQIHVVSIVYSILYRYIPA